MKMKRLHIRISSNGIEKGSSSYAWSDRVTISKKWPIVKLQNGILTLKYSRKLIFNLKTVTTHGLDALEFEVVTGKGAGRRADGLIGEY